MRACTTLYRKSVSGVASSAFFTAMRQQILDDLRANRNDKSLAGRVDPQIAPLVEFFNENFDQYVTSSSCSGRISLFHKAKSSKAPGEATNHERKRGGFGKGTLFQSHDPLTDVPSVVRGSLQPCLREWWSWREQQTADAMTLESEVLQLKFEPMILHLLCADIPAAAALLQCASESGQMNSGIVSCSRGTAEHPKITCCITSPLMVDIPLFSEGEWLLPPLSPSSPREADAALQLFGDSAWTDLLTHTLGHINTLFTENERRTNRFTEAVRQRILPPAESS